MGVERLQIWNWEGTTKGPSTGSPKEGRTPGLVSGRGTRPRLSNLSLSWLEWTYSLGPEILPGTYISLFVQGSPIH